ncbi:672_t:CDS:1, partial [Cetraspora pellucida]
VIIAATDFEIPKNLQEQLERTIEHVNKTPEKLELKEVKEYRKKIDKQLEYFEDFDKKALKCDDFDEMINLAYDILVNFASLKSENLKSTCSNEMNSLISGIDEYLPKWINSCIEITNRFNKFYDDLSNFITDNNIKDNLLFFEIQEELLIKVVEVKEKLRKKHGTLNYIISSIKSLDEK